MKTHQLIRYLNRNQPLTTVAWVTVMLLVTSAAATFVSGQEEAVSVEFQVVVHSSNELKSLDRKEVATYFVEARPSWPNGTFVKPINLQPESQVRIAFSEEVIQLTVDKVRVGWRRLLFQGKGLPPPERTTDEEILDFVGASPQAIGYVSVNTNLGEYVKVLEIVDTD